VEMGKISNIDRQCQGGAGMNECVCISCLRFYESDCGGCEYVPAHDSNQCDVCDKNKVCDVPKNPELYPQ